uniref:Structure-specific endonuclease subunit SLX1 homolog n=1 Tax=Caligus clemensi TaxID=344056 RepID=C1C1X5_CALCM|nr:Structure-specific endonuclease SLX1 [Caligus clemensi]
MSEADLVESFFGCYLLICENPKYKGRMYVGFTVDPVRRLKQHNAGAAFGGARRTSAKGPWSMVLLVQGFPNQISALRFEWAWQHPSRSRRLSSVIPSKAPREKSLNYHVRVVATMLLTPPWSRLPLTLRWLREDLSHTFPSNINPPIHMPIVYGPVISVKLSKNKSPLKKDEGGNLICSVCFSEIDSPDELVKCISPKCSAAAHITCLANHFLVNEPEKMIPVSGKCPVCDLDVLWGDIIRKKKGCYSELEEMSLHSSS